MREVVSLLFEFITKLHETLGFFDFTLGTELFDFLEEIVDLVAQDLNPLTVG